MQTTRTIDHEEIQDWIESRGGAPAVVEGTHDEFGTGILKVDFGQDEDMLEELSWEEFFRIFDGNDLAFVYEDATDEGEASYFCKFVARTDDTDLGNYSAEDTIGDVDVSEGL